MVPFIIFIIHGKEEFMLCKQAWDSCQNIFEQIKQHPFNVELKNGTLDATKFQFYIQQDSLYLIDYARVLAFAAAKAEKPDHIVKLLKFAEHAIVAERDLHQGFEINFSNIKKSIACSMYTNFLLSVTATGSLIEILAAVLPCFWHYQELGVYIKNNSSKSNPYIKWIDKYSSEEFRNATNSIVELTDELSKDISASSYLGQKFLNIFREASKLEVFFWDDAYNCNQRKICSI